MGINLEYMTLLQILRQDHLLAGNSVLELGAQDISADFSDMAKHARRFAGMENVPEKIKTARELYKIFGYADYQAIDATGEHGAHVFDLNTDIKTRYAFTTQFDLVTNLGTIEHCFNVAQAFENMHNICREGGIMVHAFPSSGNANHGFYNMQPRLFALMAQANNYDILDYFFTVDYKPQLRMFSNKAYRAYDDRDLMCYVAFRKKNSNKFVYPFDSMFDDKNQLQEYKGKGALDINEFRSYIKGTWTNVKPRNLCCVPTGPLKAIHSVKQILKKIFDKISTYI